jgi:hypothetical protein
VPLAYVCRGRTCSLPVREPAALGALLDADADADAAAGAGNR